MTGERSTDRGGSAELDRERLLRDVECATLLDVSTTTFRNYVTRGQMPPARVLGGRRRWMYSEIIEALRRLPAQASRTTS